MEQLTPPTASRHSKGRFESCCMPGVIIGQVGYGPGMFTRLSLPSVLIAGLCFVYLAGQLVSFLSMTCHVDTHTTTQTILIKIGFGIDDFREFNCMWSDIRSHFDVDVGASLRCSRKKIPLLQTNLSLNLNHSCQRVALPNQNCRRT